MTTTHIHLTPILRINRATRLFPPLHLHGVGSDNSVIRAEGYMYPFRNKDNFYGEELLVPRPTPQAGGPPLFGRPRLLIQYIRSYLPYRRPFLHPQPEDAPCRGDREPLITALEQMVGPKRLIVYLTL